MDNIKTYSAKSIAIKSGSRYVDELVVLTKTNLNEVFIEVYDPDAAIKKKEQQVKASFKVEMNDQEREARDNTTANLYHTGAKAQHIVISAEDLDELQNDNLRLIEEGIKEEPEDDGDDDDPDDDLDF